MRVKVHDIPGNGLSIRETVNCSVIGLKPEDVKCLSPLLIEADIHKAESAVIVRAQVQGEFETMCRRCLDPIVDEQVKDFDLYIEIDPAEEFVDIGEELRQEIIVEFSGSELCKEDCKGLCPDCGGNLNREECKCTKNS